jgi:hypothetical protein
MTDNSLQARIQRMEDVNQIKNLMSRYSYLHTAGMDKECMELYAKKTPGVRVTMSDLGTWEGIEGLKRFYMGFLPHIHGDRVGYMTVHTNTTNVIEVAGDSKTAKAVIISPGAGAHRNSQGKLEALWIWVKAAQDLVKEDGQWRFWHLHMYSIFTSTFERSWVDCPPPPPPVIPDQFKPDKTGTIDYPYTTTSVQVLVPAPPEPYETFDEKNAY